MLHKKLKEEEMNKSAFVLKIKTYLHFSLQIIKLSPCVNKKILALMDLQRLVEERPHFQRMVEEEPHLVRAS